MMTYSKSTKRSAEKTVRDIRRATRRNYSAEEKTRIVQAVHLVYKIRCDERNRFSMNLLLDKLYYAY